MLQRFFLFIFIACALNLRAAELQTGNVAHLSFHDVDGNEHSTANGQVTIITVITRQNEEMAKAVADRVPDRFRGNPKFRYITLINFQRKLFSPLQGLTKTVIRNRLNLEADRLRPDYAAKKIARDPRKDILVVADFDGAAVAQLGLAPESDGVSVFVFNGHGRINGRWSGVPPEEAFVRAIVAE